MGQFGVTTHNCQKRGSVWGNRPQLPTIPHFHVFRMWSHAPRILATAFNRSRLLPIDLGQPLLVCTAPTQCWAHGAAPIVALVGLSRRPNCIQVVCPHWLGPCSRHALPGSACPLFERCPWRCLCADRALPCAAYKRLCATAALSCAALRYLCTAPHTPMRCLARARASPCACLCAV